jgi:hypothetical protein
VTTPVCRHEHTTQVDAGHVCDTCGEVLERPVLRGVTGGQSTPTRRRQLELVREVRRSLHPVDGDR